MKNKINVIHIYKDFDTFNGLIETFYFIAKYHNPDIFNFGVCVFNYGGGEYGQKFQDLGGKLYNLNCGHGAKGFINTMIRLKRFLKEVKPDIVVTRDRRGNFLGIPAAKRAKVPVIISTETTQMHSATTVIRRMRDRVFHPVLLFLVSLTDAFVAISNNVKENWKFVSRFTKIKVIYPPFNLEKYHQAVSAGNRALYMSRDFPTIGYIGRLSEEKGPHYLIRALPQIRQKFPLVKLLIAGAGAMENALRALAKSEKVEDRVFFLGFQDNTFKVLQQMDLLVVPSRSDGCPVAILEAMAMRLPVIATRVGGIPELITDEVGLLVPPRNYENLADSIISLVSKPELMRSMGEAGNKLAFTKFSPLSYIKQYEELYFELLRKKGFHCD